MRSWPAINRFKHPLFIRSFYSFLFSVRSKAFSFPLEYILLPYSRFVCLLYECIRSVVLVEILTFWSFLKISFVH